MKKLSKKLTITGLPLKKICLLQKLEPIGRVEPVDHKKTLEPKPWTLLTQNPRN